jgi:hypothetical protein
MAPAVDGETHGGWDMAGQEQQHSASRRQFVIRAAYVAPVVLSLKVAPAYAKTGSEKPKPPSDANPKPKPKPKPKAK